VKPLVYGYTRTDQGLPDADVAQLEIAMKFWAEQEDYCLAAVFRERDPISRAAFHELISELMPSEVQHVIVPALDHISTHPMIRIARSRRHGMRNRRRTGQHDDRDLDRPPSGRLDHERRGHRRRSALLCSGALREEPA